MRGTLWRHWEFYRWIGCINPCITSWFLYFYLVTRQDASASEVNLATLLLLDMWYLQFTLILTLQIIPDKLLFKITVNGCSFNWCHSRLSNFVWNIYSLRLFWKEKLSGTFSTDGSRCKENTGPIIQSADCLLTFPNLNTNISRTVMATVCFHIHRWLLWNFRGSYTS